MFDLGFSEHSARLRINFLQGSFFRLSALTIFGFLRFALRHVRLTAGAEVVLVRAATSARTRIVAVVCGAPRVVSRSFLALVILIVRADQPFGRPDVVVAVGLDIAAAQETRSEENIFLRLALDAFEGSLTLTMLEQ
jgi:hypothetical protein